RANRIFPYVATHKINCSKKRWKTRSVRPTRSSHENKISAAAGPWCVLRAPQKTQRRRRRSLAAPLRRQVKRVSPFVLIPPEDIRRKAITPSKTPRQTPPKNRFP